MPARDLRQLIAIDVVREFPERVARRPERYAMPKEKTTVAAVKAELESVLALAAARIAVADRGLIDPGTPFDRWDTWGLGAVKLVTYLRRWSI